eukprot:246630_1
MSAITESYSPFEKELLSHISNLSTNVSTLVQLFVNLQSQFTLLNASNTTPTSAPQTTTTSNQTIPVRSSPPTRPSKPITKQVLLSPTQSKTTALPESVVEEKKAANDDDKAAPVVALSLDSSDSADEESNELKPLPTVTQPKPKSYNPLKYRSKYGLNRSKSTTSSASMTALLRANHIRNHKYNGMLRNKCKRKAYDEISDSVVNRKRKHGPTFNPEHVFLSQNNRIIINVGGSSYETTLNTLSADQSSMLSAMFSGRFKIERDENGSIFIDRDPTHFRHILNFLRDGIDYLKHGGLLQQPDAIVNELLQEAKYYNIRPLVDYIQLQQTRKNKKKGDELTHEKQYKLVTNIGIDQFEDVFNKYTGSAGYDFEEWIFVSPYKTSRNSASAPTFMMLFSKKLSRAEVRLLDRLTNIDFQ